ncbi:MAG: DUF3108 domain-containing protein [Bacteroidales bacterium]|nr:DUF3108 domain-containing protein [Bacteroidales bacterium]
MKRLFFAGMLALAAFGASAQINIPFQQINYKVHYHWGVVDVNIANGTATIQTDGDNFSATLNGNSIPWGGRIFCVSDTLQATMTPNPSGLSSEHVNYQNGWYMKPRKDEYSGAGFTANCGIPYKNIVGEGNLNASDNTMEAITITSDMLAMFYYFREIDFESMNPGQSLTIPISGGFANEVTLTYNGRSEDTSLGSPVYSVDYEYAYHGAPSGYPVHSEVDVYSRLPLLISAQLPVGHVEMIQD